MNNVRFALVGKIRGKARPRVTCNGVYTPRATKEYEELVRTAYKCAAKGAYFGSIKGSEIKKQLRVEIIAYFAVPKSYTRGKRLAAENNIIRPTKKPDCDNIGKIVCDALNGAAWDDDAQVVDMRVEKWYTSGDERLEVWISEAEGNENE